MATRRRETPCPSPDVAVQALASYVTHLDRARYRAAAIDALDEMAKAQQFRNPPSPIEEALVGSYALCDAERLRTALLQRIVGPRFPLDLLGGSPWKFGTEADRLPADELIAAVQTFIEDFYGEDFDPATHEVCRPDDVVLEAPLLVLLGCSHPPEAVPRFFLKRLLPDDGKAFRSGELMVKVIAAAADELRDSGHRFFQGLDLKERVGDPVQWLPLYQMRFSSDFVPPGVDPQIGWDRLRDLERWRAQRRGQRPPSEHSADEGPPLSFFW